MGDINWIAWVFESYQRIAGFANALFNLLFYEFTIIGYDISLWAFVGGVGITGIIVASIVKKVAPLL